MWTMLSFRATYTEQKDSQTDRRVPSRALPTDRVTAVVKYCLFPACPFIFLFIFPNARFIDDLYLYKRKKMFSKQKTELLYDMSG